MYAEIIPQLRTLPHLGVFDYRIPNNFDIHSGQLVEIDFRKNKYPGLVLKIKSQSQAKKLKSIQKIITDYEFSKAQLDFLTWFAEYYQISPALALKTILPEIPKKKSNISLPSLPPAKKIKIAKHRISAIKKILPLTSYLLPLLVHYNNFDEKIAFYAGLIKQNRQTLILVPEKQSALEIASCLNSFKPLIINAELSKNQLWQSWLTPAKVIIGTKIAIFYPPKNLSLIIIDDEENKSHKNYDHNPRYHVRDCAEKICQLNKIKLVLTSQVPSLESNYKYKKTNLLLPTPYSLLLVNMEDERKKGNYTWFSEELINQIKQKKSLLLFNRKGLAKLLICRDCQEIFSYQALAACPACRGQNLKTASPGTSQLASQLRQILPNKKIVQITKEEKIDLDFDIALGTEYALRVLNLDSLEFIGIISVDHQLIIPDFRAAERVYQLLTCLINLNKPLILQTNAPDNIILQSAMAQDYEKFYRHELAQRKLLNYPPFQKKIKKIKKNSHTIIDYA